MEENEIKETQEETPNTTAEETTNEAPQKEKRRFGRKNNDSAKMEEMTTQLQEMGEKLAEMNDKYVRSVAEFENYRKRTKVEIADLIVNGGKEMVKSILPVIDDLERALQAMTDENSKEGVTMIYNKLMNTLQQKGLKVMEAKGEKFNEEFHEAITQIPAPTEELKGTVLDVVEKGYFFNDKVLRYAKVVYGM